MDVVVVLTAYMLLWVTLDDECYSSVFPHLTDNVADLCLAEIETLTLPIQFALPVFSLLHRVGFSDVQVAATTNICATVIQHSLCRHSRTTAVCVSGLVL
ncbi:hypothetical protein AMECASPLE_027213 [Ameca splendens]|uniref:Secreted protein n=1 Tax=Ameca splendens TaxID=208324 RepID=A0ABV0ZQP3_9TELE